jgi:hypothetical protein
MHFTAHLNGGPMHDMKIALPFGTDHFHVEGLVDCRSLQMRREHPEPLPEHVKTRMGTYSAVSRYPGEFEWDGWEQK